MHTAWLLLPDFLLIVFGFLLCRFSPLGRPVWDSVEKLVYHLLFPVLLFTAILRSPMQPGATALLAGGGVFTVLAGIGLVRLLERWPGVDRVRLASGAQTAFRFNSYVALALADRLVGASGVAWTALLIALCVPLCNAAAVWTLARHGGQQPWREMARNPLIVATVSGLAASLVGLHLPEPLMISLQRVGSAALPLGLMAVGAGLRIGGLKAAPALAAALMGIRHVLLPAVGLAWALAWSLPLPQRLTLVAFTALPTASSAFVLAVRMGGDGPFVAGLITVSTVLGMVSIPVWVAIAGLWPGG